MVRVDTAAIANLSFVVKNFKTLIVADCHSLKLVMKIPLKSADRQFTLYELVATPSRISGNKFIQYQPDFSYLAVAHNRRDYLLLDETQVQQCTSGSVIICPSMAALYDVQTLTCEASLFFQYEGGRQVCRRRLLLDYDLPTVQRHGSVWVYHFPDRHQVLIRCPRGDSRSEVLHGAGIIHGATSCSIASSKIRTLPELRGSADVRFDTPDVYLPDLPKILTDREMPQIEQVASTKNGWHRFHSAQPGSDAATIGRRHVISRPPNDPE
jgi:hypothetical protein